MERQPVVSDSIRVGVTFPQLEISNPHEIRFFAKRSEDLRFRFLTAFDHVLGVDPARPAGWDGSYDRFSSFHEPMVLLSHLAAVTSELELVTGVLVLPQRQTALVAKQAAALDVLSGGRVRLGVGIGWNQAEYEALGEDFTSRAARIEEQVAVLRLLWTNEVVEYSGSWHRIDFAGLNPLPVQRPIPVWMGGYAEPAVRRAARVADGWIRGSAPSEWQEATSLNAVEQDVQRFRKFVEESGRKESNVGVQVRMNAADGTPKSWAMDVKSMQGFGVTHVEFNTMGIGLRSTGQRITVMARFAEELE